MIEGTLTGRTRYRQLTRVFGDPLLVLQVEVSFDDGPPDCNGMPTYLAGVAWRDAQVTDLALLPPPETCK